jgi:nucleotide-binding universal stress UspA family protein
MSTKPKILIGYDGSESADAALDDLTHAGLPHNAEVQILSIAEWLSPAPASSSEIKDQEGAPESGCVAAKAALRLAEKACDRLRAIFPNWIVNASSSCGTPASKIIERADEWKPDLIVVGSHGRTALGRLVLGSVSQRVLTAAPCSVRIARGRLEESDYPVRIIVGLDGSPASLDAVREVAARQWPARTEVKVVVVDDPLFPDFLRVIPPLAKVIADDRDQERAWATTISTEPLTLLRRSGVKVSSELREGDPKKELPKAAEEWGADCIFLGSVGFNNRFERLVLGSVSATVAARARCSVEVVRSKPKNN